MLIVFDFRWFAEFVCSTRVRTSASVSLPISFLASCAAVIRIIASRATLQTTGSGTAMFASCWFSHQGDAALPFTRHRSTQAPPKVDLLEAEKEFLVALLHVQHLLDQAFQIPECRRRKHRKLAPDSMHSHDRYQHIAFFAHDLARV